NPTGEMSGMATRPRLTAAQRRQIVDAVQKAWGSTLNHGEPLILDGLIKNILPIGQNAREMDYLKSGSITKDRIFQSYGVSPIIAGEISPANLAGAQVANSHFIDFTISPKIELLSQTLTSWLRVVFNDPSLVIWIEPCVANNDETMLARANL